MNLVSIAAGVACRGHRRVRGQGCAGQAALGVPLGELWPNAGSSEAVGSENCGKFFGFQAAFCTRHLPNDIATIYLGWRTIAIRGAFPRRARSRFDSVRLRSHCAVGLRSPTSAEMRLSPQQDEDRSNRRSKKDPTDTLARSAGAVN